MISNQNEKVVLPWGYYIKIEDDILSNYKITKIVLYPKKKQSLQMQSNCCKSLLIIKGTPCVFVENLYYFLNPTDNIYIGKNEKHKIENYTKKNVELIETQIFN